MRLFDGLVTAAIVLWAVCFVAGIRNLRHPTSYSALYVAGAVTADDYPTVTGVRPFLAGEEIGIKVGDRVIRVGKADLRGAGPVRFFATFVDEIGEARDLETEIEREGARQVVAVPGGSTRPILMANLPASLGFFVAAIVLWLRAPPSPMSRAFIAWFLVTGVYLAAHFFGGPSILYPVYAIHAVCTVLLGPLALRALLLFPDGEVPEGGMPRWPWLFAALSLAHTGHFGWPMTPQIGNPAAALITAALLATGVAIVARRYRSADAIGKRRLRWFYFGLYSAAMPPILTAALSTALPALAPFYFASLGAVAFIPIALLISIVRFNLFDIDRLISAAASYNLLLVVALAVAATIVPMTAEAAAELLGVDRWTTQFALLVPLGLLVVAASSWLRPRIESVFFADRHALDVGTSELTSSLFACGDVESLIRCLGDRLFELFRPVGCAIYVRSPARFEPVHIRGTTVAASIAADGPFEATVEAHRGPLAFDDPGFDRSTDLSPFDRAVLQTLDAAVVAPVWQAEEPAMLLCLGRKRSGDIYTPTDLRLLAGVAEHAQVQLERFRQAELLTESRRMQQALRRYVPGAVADALETGHALEPKRQEITVLFVDLRGYTAYCEGLAPEQIFATVARYTEAVSGILARHGGTLIEFNGDGMMAMFGAPRPAPAKESAAVRAAQEIVVEVPALPRVEPESADLSVGVGISSGEAFVGSIRSHDRNIWTAVGNTVNLAARLQAITRELEALIAIDRPTFVAAGLAAAGFRCQADVAIRGRSASEDIFILPRLLRAS